MIHASSSEKAAHSSHVTESDFYTTVARLVKGTVDQKALMILHLASSQTKKDLSAIELFQVGDWWCSMPR